VIGRHRRTRRLVLLVGFQAATIDVSHVVGDTRVAIIKGQWLLTKGPGDHNTQFESVLSFPLCRSVVTSAEFALLDPFVGYVRDCSGAVMPPVPVSAGKRAKGRTNGRGFYLLHVGKAGYYRVTATAGGGTAHSPRVHVP
jgi:hypothetical protein